MPDTYPLPTASPLADISQWIGILLGAVDIHLDTPEAWEQSDWESAETYLEDLRVWLTELPESTPTMSEIAIIIDQKPAGTDGGTFTSGAWRTRDLNTVVSSQAWLSLANNQFTLQPGTYLISWTCSAFRVGSNQSRLLTGSFYVVGSTEYSFPTYPTSVQSIGRYIFTLGSDSSFELQHRCASNYNNEGYGRAAGFDDEIYSTVEITKVS